MKTTLIRFNPRRASRTGAAEVEMDDGENVMRLWMTENDLKKNLTLFADESPEAMQGFKDGLAAYATPWKAFPVKA